MWALGEDSAAAVSDGDSSFSEDEGDIQCEILEKQRDEANERLSELEQVSCQLLKEIDVLEVQFQIERSCRESAEALAVKVTKDNKVLKRRSQMLMPLISELPENMATMTFDLETDPEGDPSGLDEDSSEEVLLQGQAQIAELQASVDRLLAEKVQLEQQVETLTRENAQLREQMAVEMEEKEVILRKVSKQSKTMNKIKRVSQFVSEEFTEMSQKLELEQGLRQHAEVFAHQMLVQQRDAHRQSMVLMQSTETSLQLQRALEQVANISTALQEIQLHHQNQVKQSQTGIEDSRVQSELQTLRGQLERSEEERRALETQLSDTQTTVKQLQDEAKEFQDRLMKEAKTDQLGEEASTPAPPHPPPPPPPPPPPLPPPSAAVNQLVALRNRRKEGVSEAAQTKPVPLVDMKTRAVDEMMERIRRGIVLRPTTRPLGSQEDESSWKDQRTEKRKSAVLELKGMLDTMKRQGHRRAASRKRISRNVGEAELHLVLQRRRRALGDPQDHSASTETQDGQVGHPCAPAAGALPWASEGSDAPVLRRLRQNREKRDSCIRASALIISQGN